METGRLVIIAIFYVLAAGLAWLLSTAKPRGVAVLAVIGLVLTTLGAALIAIIFLVPRPTPTGAGSLGGLSGLVIFLQLVLGMLLEVPGILVTLAVCLLSLWRTARGRPAWPVALLLGAFLPLLVSAAILIFLSALGEALPRIEPQDNGARAYYGVLTLSALLPVLAAVTVTAYAVAAARATSYRTRMKRP